MDYASQPQEFNVKALPFDLVSLSKIDIFRLFFERGYVDVYLHPEESNVCVPEHLKLDKLLTLRFGSSLQVPTLDARVNRIRLQATLSFNKRPFVCSIPWNSVYAIIGQEEIGVWWANDKVLLLRKTKVQPKLEVLNGDYDAFGCDEQSNAAALYARSKFHVVKD